MKKLRLLISIALFIIFLIALSFYLLFFFKITEDRYNKIMKYYIARKITDGLSGFQDRVIAMRDYVHETVHPVERIYNRPDTVAIDKLISGTGWCDQQSRVFMQLASSIGITSRLLFLRSDSGSSPHAVVEALSPRKRWVIVDPANELDLINKEGRLATQSDIKEDLGIVVNSDRVRTRAKFEKAWADKNFLSIYFNTPSYIITREGVKFDFLKPIPALWLRPIVTIIQDRYFEQNHDKIENAYGFKLAKARGYHMVGHYERSGRLYDEVIKEYRNLTHRRKAEYYYAMLLKDQKRYDDAYRYLISIIKQTSDKLYHKIIERSPDAQIRRKAELHYALLRQDPKKYRGSYRQISNLIDLDNKNPYIEYLYGLRATILKEMGRPDEAEQDLLKIRYSLDAS